MSLAHDQWEALELSRQELHLANGESGVIVLEKRDTNGAFAEIILVERAWSKRRINLGMGVFAEEFQIAESEIDQNQADIIHSVNYERRRFRIEKVMTPEGTSRLWRLKIQPMERLDANSFG